ncbi:RNA-binding protein [Sporosarcina luteola]|uniref:YlmH family RNA-binding protein n=1 Tax=Sporosarcina luteola TaxID=582850 RepID=UPI002040A3BE|nr:RNA-binding protein [Sporosarcina luteola]MCM3637943.1 RNA-binding protein [Sporosarcina luteola]
MDSIIQHFRKEEQPFIETVVGWTREVEDTYSPKLTGFLDPRQIFILNTIVRNTGLQFGVHGAFPEPERQRALIYPDYYEPEDDDFQVSIFTVRYPAKFMTLEHKDILGSIMALGIDRSKFGDIRLEGDVAQFAVAEEMKDYLIANLTSIGKSKVRVEELGSSDELIVLAESWKEELHTISSLRLDSIVASLVNCPRQKAVSLIQNDKVKVNHVVRDQQAFEVNESDILSIRGSGRFKIMSIEGRTRKDKIRLLIGRLE